MNNDPLKQPDVKLRELNSQPSTPGPREEVYCTKIGATHPEEMYIVGAHMDGIGWGEAANCKRVRYCARHGTGAHLQQPGRSDRAVHSICALEQRRDRPKQGTRLCCTAQGSAGRRIARRVNKYPEPKWLGMIQHDMMMFDHGMPLKEGRHHRQTTTSGGRYQHRVSVHLEVRRCRDGARTQVPAGRR